MDDMTRVSMVVQMLSESNLGMICMHPRNDDVAVYSDVHGCFESSWLSRRRSMSNSSMWAESPPVSMAKIGPIRTNRRSCCSATIETPSGRGMIRRGVSRSKPYRSRSSFGMTIRPAESILVFIAMNIFDHLKYHLLNMMEAA